MKKLANFKIKNLKIVSDETNYSQPAFMGNETEKIWNIFQNKAISSKRALWNGTLYRLSDFFKDGDLVKLKLSPIDYKLYLAIPFFKKQMGKLQFLKRINGLYVAAQILTLDEKFLIGRTSSNSLFPHKYDLISGSLSKDRMTVNKTSDLVSYIRNELVEETGIGKEYIKKIEGICIMVTTSSRIGIFFRIDLNVSSSVIKEVIKTNFEHKEILILNNKDLKQLIKTSGSAVNPTVRFTLREISS